MNLASSRPESCDPCKQLKAFHDRMDALMARIKDLSEQILFLAEEMQARRKRISEDEEE